MGVSILVWTKYSTVAVGEKIGLYSFCYHSVDYLLMWRSIFSWYTRLVLSAFSVHVSTNHEGIFKK